MLLMFINFFNQASYWSPDTCILFIIISLKWTLKITFFCQNYILFSVMFIDKRAGIPNGWTTLSTRGN